MPFLHRTRCRLQLIVGSFALWLGVMPCLCAASWTWASGWSVGTYEGGLFLKKFHQMSVWDKTVAVGYHDGLLVGITLRPALSNNAYQWRLVVPSIPFAAIGLLLVTTSLRSVARLSNAVGGCPQCGYPRPHGDGPGLCPECGSALHPPP